jgi:hypothetical protein
VVVVPVVATILRGLPRLRFGRCTSGQLFFIVPSVGGGGGEVGRLISWTMIRSVEAINGSVMDCGCVGGGDGGGGGGGAASEMDSTITNRLARGNS